ncbi:MAG: metal-dependent hydrolase [Acidobacteriota bacterium]
MENFTHTLFGLTLAKAGLERATPLATTTLLIASNMPDIDFLMRFRGTFEDLETHRGITHSFTGVAALAAFLTLILVFLDKRFRLRHDPFRRPIKPLRIFWLAYLGGLLHIFLDYTNNYGVRPLLPFSDRWFYGDFIFVVDPWIWLILGSALVWLTTNSSARIFIWLAIGILLSLIMGFALQEPSARFPLTISLTIRIIWFAGLLIILFGAIRRWGERGERLARYSLLALGIYYLSMFMAHNTAVEQTRNNLPAEGVTSVAAWPTPANPYVWNAVAATTETTYSCYINLNGGKSEWVEAPILKPELINALRNNSRTRTFMNFARYTVAGVEETEQGYTVNLRDVRFDLKLRAVIDHDLQVKAADLKWF